MYAERTFMLLFIFSAFSTCHGLHSRTIDDELPVSLALKNLELQGSPTECHGLPFAMVGSSPQQWKERLSECSKAIMLPLMKQVPVECLSLEPEKGWSGVLKAEKPLATVSALLKNETKKLSLCSKAIVTKMEMPEACNGMKPETEWSGVTEKTMPGLLETEKKKLSNCSQAMGKKMGLPKECLGLEPAQGLLGFLKNEKAENETALPPYLLLDLELEKLADLMEKEKKKLSICSKALGAAMGSQMNLPEDCRVLEPETAWSGVLTAAKPEKNMSDLQEIEKKKLSKCYNAMGAEMGVPAKCLGLEWDNGWSGVLKAENPQQASSDLLRKEQVKLAECYGDMGVPASCLILEPEPGWSGVTEKTMSDLLEKEKQKLASCSQAMGKKMGVPEACLNLEWEQGWLAVPKNVSLLDLEVELELEKFATCFHAMFGNHPFKPQQ